MFRHLRWKWQLRQETGRAQKEKARDVAPMALYFWLDPDVTARHTNVGGRSSRSPAQLAVHERTPAHAGALRHVLHDACPKVISQQLSPGLSRPQEAILLQQQQSKLHTVVDNCTRKAQHSCISLACVLNPHNHHQHAAAAWMPLAGSSPLSFLQHSSPVPIHTW